MLVLKSYLNTIDALNEAEWRSIASIASMLTLKKGEVFVAEGEKHQQEFFLETGIVRAYLTDKEGNERSTAFFQEGEFMSTSTLRTRKGISSYSYQALCPTTLVRFDSGKFKSVLSEGRKLSAVGKVIKEKELGRIEERDLCLLQVKALDKYLEFLRVYPKIESLISQRYIASYLGITPVSLSRIKRKLLV